MSRPMSSPAKTRTSSAEDTKERILRAAQKTFSQTSYAYAGIREIAAGAGVAPSLVIKYFETKANLFEQALVRALDLAMTFDFSRPGFGQRLVDVTGDRDIDIILPAMIVLSIGDEEASRIAARVADKHVVSMAAKHIGPPDARAKAAAVLMLSSGLTIYSRYMQIESSPKVRARSRALMAKALQVVVDAPETD